MGSTKNVDVNLTRRSKKIVQTTTISGKIKAVPPCFYMKREDREEVRGWIMHTISNDVTIELAEDMRLYTDSNIDGVSSLVDSEQMKVVLMDYLDALLFPMLGGNWTIGDSTGEFIVHPRIHPGVKGCVMKLTPLLTALFTIDKFYGDFHWEDSGRVILDLCTAIYSLYGDLRQIAQELRIGVKRGIYDFGHVQSKLRPAEEVFGALAQLTFLIRKDELYGAHLLSHLHSMATCMINDLAQQSALKLVKMASRSFFKQLELWLYLGILQPSAFEFEEFMVTERKTPGEKWENKFLLELDQTPNFFQSKAQQILKCGKYINFAKSCDHKFVLTSARVKFEYELREINYSAAIDKLLQVIEKQTTAMLYDKYDLKERIESVGLLLLIQESDWLKSFLDSTVEELGHNLGDIYPHRIQSMFNSAIRSSSVARNKYVLDTKVNFDSVSLDDFLFQITSIGSESEIRSFKYDVINYKGMYLMTSYLNDPLRRMFQPVRRAPVQKDRFNIKAIHFLKLDIEVDWPLSLMLTWDSMQKYDMIFRRLLQCKYAEHLLTRFYTEWKGKDNCDSIEERLVAHAMLTFIQSYLMYCTHEIIRPHYNTFIHKLLECKCLDSMMSLHQDFVDDVTQYCMLTDPQLVVTVNQAIQTCLRFAQNSNKHQSDEIEDIKCEFTSKIDHLICEVRKLGEGTSITTRNRNRAWRYFVRRLDTGQLL